MPLSTELSTCFQHLHSLQTKDLLYHHLRSVMGHWGVSIVWLCTTYATSLRELLCMFCSVVGGPPAAVAKRLVGLSTWALPALQLQIKRKWRFLQCSQQHLFLTKG